MQIVKHVDVTYKSIHIKIRYPTGMIQTLVIDSLHIVQTLVPKVVFRLQFGCLQGCSIPIVAIALQEVRLDLVAVAPLLLV